MKASHLVLVVMAVLVAVIGVGALAGPALLNMMSGSGGDGRVSIVIATPTMMEGLVEAAEGEAAQQLGQQTASNTEEVARPGTTAAGAVPAPVQQDEAQQQRAQDAT
ncbi:MAG: hypothetical protein H7124_06595, partial [Phycisphaerales bacterium]|nr:hypothetical protein [Hyphomonadaceae bacterium]